MSNNNQAVQTMPDSRAPDAAVARAFWEVSDALFGREGDDRYFPILREIADRAKNYALSQPAGVPSWIVNDLGELGVMVNGVAYFLYKGDNIIYADAKHEDGSPMLYRIVGKREFGETCWPLKWIEAGRREERYTEKLHYAPGLSDGKPEDGDWRPLPAQAAAPAASGGEVASPSLKQIVPAERRNYLDDNGNPHSIEDEAYSLGWNACRSATLKAIAKSEAYPQPPVRDK